MTFPNWQREKWTDAPGNPLVRGFGEMRERAVQGDPQVLTPGEFDGQWHMLYHGFYDEEYTPFLHHLVSDDGYDWKMLSKQQMNVNPIFIFRDNGKWILYYSAALRREPGAVEKYGCVNMIRARVSDDLVSWSDDIDILAPVLPWEREHDASQPDCIQARNPCVVKLGEGRCRLYYSAGTILLRDCGYEEPKYIGFADGPTPLGPFSRNPEPVLSPLTKIPHRNFGAGAIKVYGWGGKFLALYNGIYLDGAGHSRSAISLLVSEDGVNFAEAPYNPIILPEGQDWKKGLVYQFDLVRFEDEMRLYYNARDGFENGIERIGCSAIKTDEPVVKLW